jgi:5-methyltetrahydrofolate--homocysteine methyltransferase
VGLPGTNEVEMLQEIVSFIASEEDVPICIDSSNPIAIEAALKVAPGKPIINSVTGEEASLSAILPLAKEYETAIIGLTMGNGGISRDPERRLEIAETIIERALRIGISIEDIIIDPLVLSVATETQGALETLATIALIKEKLGVNINIGASNVSFGFPTRQTINEAFLALAAGSGANCVITNPRSHFLSIRSIDILLGRDPYGANYVQHYRKLKKQSTTE